MASSITATTKMPAALRKLCNLGVQALKPQLIENSSTRRATHFNPPAIPKRTASMIRKRAIQEGTYGTFDATTGQGWDTSWDVELAKLGKGTGRFKLRPSKKTKRERTREQRAQKIEKNLEDMDEQIGQYYIERSQHKPVKDFEYHYKKHTASRR